MSLRTPLRTPFYESGGSISALVPSLWDAAVNGVPFMLDTEYFGTPQMTRSSIKLLKPQQASGTINEDALNPADGIRAKVESWHHGAGQAFLDRDDSDPFRFRSSKGVDPWTKWKLTLLPDTDQKLSSANTNLLLAVAGARVYVIDGQTLKYTTDITADSPTWTTVTGTPAATATSIATDGYTVWVAYTASGLYMTNTSTGAASQLVTTALASSSVVGYVKGRLVVSKDNVLWNIIDLVGPAAVPATALYTHPNTAFRWVGFAEGKSVLYAAGYSGDKTIVYKTTIKADGTALDIPTVASSTIPDGETVASISEYLGLVQLGTTKGAWVAAQDSAGNLTVNKVIDTAASVLCFEGQGEDVWFGWTNYDATSTGLGRMNLGSDTKGAEVVTPGYASDLMVTGQGAVLSVATFQELRVFTVSGLGVYAETATYVASGTIKSGLITHGMPDNKVALTVSVTHEPLDGTVTVGLASDGGQFTTIGQSVTADSTSAVLSAQTVSGETFEFEHTLATSDSSVRPMLTRTTLESNAAPGRGEFFTVPFLFRETLKIGGDNQQDAAFDCAARYQSLTALETVGVPVTYQDALGSDTVTLEDHDFVIEDWDSTRTAYIGTYIAKFRRGRRRS